VILGILSDTHDRVGAMAAAVKVLRDAGAEFFIHCGDVGSTAVLDHLAGLRAAFVFGNNDFDRSGLQRYANDIGIECLGDFGEIELAGKRIAVMHGDRPQLRRDVLQRQEHDYLLQGHTHVRNDERFGRVRAINPGALHRAAQKSVATLNLATDDLLFHLVKDV
jgi:putative phosphoesterase